MKQISDQTPMPQGQKTPSQGPDPRVTRVLLSLLLIVGGLALLRGTLGVPVISNEKAEGTYVERDLVEPLNRASEATLSFRTASTDIILEDNTTPELVEGTYTGPKGASMERSGSNSGRTADLNFHEQYPRGYRGPLVLFGGTAPRLRLNINNEVPVQLNFSTASGEMNLDASHLQLLGLKSTSASGDLRVVLPEKAEMNVSLRTVSGELRVRSENQDSKQVNDDARFEASTVSGDQDIELDQTRFERVSVTGNSGELSLTLPPVNDLTAETRTVSGDQRIRIPDGASGTLTIQSTSGEVIVELPSDLDARITTSSVSGEIITDGFTQRGNNTYESGNGTADLTIQVKTVSGDIFLNRNGGL
ncbi:DUF4097 family beta strand repeat-containing protein [Deinococcus cellulosilyticus]|uniref:DUF4097 domain-containing protein n=1 Tax=Deinococcus cellulosilyticus (strain DSM 18568 / NBRC 106333 / KACC 11606 / 5516J-15) TaxID=1223518 RepID=A0A511MZX1_DEIC1|nr:DUF4097 family beta strand repeat-containing protein [Deinococcus cellulosilyticus]GEM46099.1 hypothetical protein DC3_17340 [Deinococcus cellulosilyticus NBRC 106333 = KACC 11606]